MDRLLAERRVAHLRAQLQLMNRVDDILATEQKWTQGQMARNRAGVEVSVRAADASCFCLRGAVARAHEQLRPAYRPLRPLVERLDRIAMSRGEQYLNMIEFNDDPATTFQHVREVIGTCRVQIARDIAIIRHDLFLDRSAEK